MIDSRAEDPDFADDGSIDVEHYPVPAGLLEVWADVLREESTLTRKAQSKNEFGHRDNLKPGMRLHLRKSHCRPDEDHYVTVLDSGFFSWNGTSYSNGRRLLKAVTRKASPSVTVRRYFALGGEQKLATVTALRKALTGKAIVAKRSGIVYLSGDISALPFDSTYLTSPSEAQLPEEAARTLLFNLEGRK
tara:strand:+ start:3102 stop:3671 length:570 start_codon:yes stop_codon:yes gene_type:complete